MNKSLVSRCNTVREISSCKRRLSSVTIPGRMLWKQRGGESDASYAGLTIPFLFFQTLFSVAPVFPFGPQFIHHFSIVRFVKSVLLFF